MTPGNLYLLAFFGLLCIFTIARVGVAVISNQKLGRAFLWTFGTFFFGVYLAMTSPIGAGFDAVMRGFIQVAALIL